MDKPTAQRLQAIIALMVGAFTFGCYITYQESVSYVEKNVINHRLETQENDIKKIKERIIRLEILTGP